VTGGPVISRFDLAFPARAAELKRLSPLEQRSRALDLARQALAETELTDPALERPMLAAEAGRYADAVARDEALAIARTLDGAAADLREVPGRDEDYMRLYRQARAASSVACLFDEDSESAALETSYEAGAALDDGRALPEAELRAAFMERLRASRARR
jgi:hypothetical protein